MQGSYTILAVCSAIQLSALDWEGGYGA